MQEVRELTGLPVTVEVAKASHVDLCLEFGIDVLWIGARTAVNPFAVQEIADALKGVDIPVLLKNPINPDLALWLGGIERLMNAGIQEIGAIHRGFSNLGEKVYRNRPSWQLAIEFKNRMPDIPLLCDPSHICGRRDILHDVAQKALDLDYDGLMFESHIDPDNAWSDAKQQITPERLGELIGSLVVREDHEDDLPIQNELYKLRQEISHIDEEIFNLLTNRMKVARNIGQYKKVNNITILQQKRWNEVVNTAREFARKHDLSEDFVVRYLQVIHDESINQQEDVMSKE
jgi:chorismate mutase